MEEVARQVASAFWNGVENTLSNKLLSESYATFDSLLFTHFLPWFPLHWLCVEFCHSSFSNRFLKRQRTCAHKLYFLNRTSRHSSSKVSTFWVWWVCSLNVCASLRSKHRLMSLWRSFWSTLCMLLTAQGLHWHGTPGFRTSLKYFLSVRWN